MRKLIMRGNGESEIREVPDLKPAPGEVLIRTTMSALCGSELKAYRTKGIENSNGGHEAIGVVAALGDGVTTLREGQRVGVSAIAGCGRPECGACAQGQSTYCTDRRFYGAMHAESFITVPSACLLLPDDVPDESGVLITGDALGVPYHTSRKIESPSVKTIAVFGCGPIGLGNVLLQSYLKRRVIAVDISSERLKLAQSLGAQITINAAEQDPVAAVLEQTGGRGCDAAIEAAGIPATVAQCFNSVRTAGTVVFNGEQEKVCLSPSSDFIRRDITAVGSWFYQVGEYPAMLNLFRVGLPVSNLVTHVFPFEEAPEAFRVFSSGTSGKILLRF